ncbi:interferon-induced protein 44-like isoform X2 [Hypomesus transpacificus]|nr:interferon-induced protein 44-like isoform X2 [Hypomesus transpacificus]XP_046896862.1 interferon-induced protein 44-like isoform X2 [Hypomesus transpacificus]
MIKELKQFSLNDPDMGQLRILLMGQIGAGKSSFVNSIKSAISGRMATDALADADAGTSFTKNYKTHYIKDGKGRLPFAFNDIMGLEPNESRGVHTDDIVSILGGHVREGYQLNPTCPLTQEKPDYNSSPELKHRVHCLVRVVSANDLYALSDGLKHRLRTIREKASSLEIPQFIVMTKVDNACPEVKRDLRNIYKSKAIKKQMETCSNELGIPVSCILPVKNYHEETKTNNEADVLVLEAVTQIVHAANDYIWTLQQE